MTKPMATRQAFGEALLALGAEREDFVVLGADLGKAMFTSAFQQKYPHRLINFGIAEQNLMTAAADWPPLGSRSWRALMPSLLRCGRVSSSGP